MNRVMFGLLGLLLTGGITPGQAAISDFDAVMVAEAVMVDDFHEFIDLDPDDKVAVANALRTMVGEEEFEVLRERYVAAMIDQTDNELGNAGLPQLAAVETGSDDPDVNGSPYDWPRSLWDFKYPFNGVTNNWWSGEVWKITCGYTCGKHKYPCYPGAAKNSVDLVRDDGHPTLGSFVLAPARGRVTFAGWQSGYGWCVEMDHGSGYRSIVAHLACDPNLFTAVGHDLLQGTLVGIAGSSGTTIPHIHFSVWWNNCSAELYGISGGGSVVEGGRYCSGNGYVTAPRGRTSCP